MVISEGFWYSGIFLDFSKPYRPVKAEVQANSRELPIHDLIFFNFIFNYCKAVYTLECRCQWRLELSDPMELSFSQLWGYEPRCWELDSGPLQEQDVLLTPELWLQPSCFISLEKTALSDFLHGRECSNQPCQVTSQNTSTASKLDHSSCGVDFFMNLYKFYIRFFLDTHSMPESSFIPRAVGHPSCAALNKAETRPQCKQHGVGAARRDATHA